MGPGINTLQLYCGWNVDGQNPGNQNFSWNMCRMSPNIANSAGFPESQNHSKITTWGYIQIYIYIYNGPPTYNCCWFLGLSEFTEVKNKSHSNNPRVFFTATCLGFCRPQWVKKKLKHQFGRISIYLCQGLNSHYFHIIGDKLINPSP